MKVAIIDLGTNTFNILIADIRKGQPTDYLLKTKSAVMLGKEPSETEDPYDLIELDYK